MHLINKIESLSFFGVANTMLLFLYVLASVAQWLARSAVNRKVGSSILPGGDLYFS